jgi:glyceraldehyde 3-phosphate dehydrogenase
MPVNRHYTINGFGRIGRNVLRAIYRVRPQGHRSRRHQRSRPGRDQRPSAALRQRAWPLPGEVKVDPATPSSRQRQQDQGHRDQGSGTLPWKELGVDIALECTGIFTAKDKARRI